VITLAHAVWCCTCLCSGSGRKLQQQVKNQTLQMAEVLPWDDEIIARATRLARYASAIHGCLPSTPDKPQLYTDANGARQ
jgi:hypothetical protein